MPKSKRQREVTLSKVAKKTKEQKESLYNEIQENADKYRYCWVFDVGNMRNDQLKIVRSLWKDSARIFFGRCAVMAKALGTSPETEHKDGLHKIANQLKGQVGLLFTSSPPPKSHPGSPPSTPPPSRAPATPPPHPHHPRRPHPPTPLHPTRALPAQRGAPTPQTRPAHELGEKLSAEQAQLLKLTGRRVVAFRVRLRWRWDGTTGEVVKVEDEDEDEDEDVVEGIEGIEGAAGAEAEADDKEDDEEMSD
ncbi:mRNA turnover 4 [Pyrrhoderma noxium]|uniref:mRNA turnover 4 n=1 Tax=Pyrrhoderma noxium TaxID=2282107 RepID=A0A286UD78_9AGAM|nr:mRNA turnover 4 [Pyrrhoderma noxium]